MVALGFMNVACSFTVSLSAIKYYCVSFCLSCLPESENVVGLLTDRTQRIVSVTSVLFSYLML